MCYWLVGSNKKGVLKGVIKTPNGLFELGLIDVNKLPEDYEYYLIVLSAWARKPEQYEIGFELLRKILIDVEDQEKCKFVLLAPKKFINASWFYTKVLS